MPGVRHTSVQQQDVHSFGQEIVDSRMLLEFDKIYAYGLLLIIMVSLFELLPKLIALVYNKIKYKKEEVK